jgi:hypothetical protein
MALRLFEGFDYANATADLYSGIIGGSSATSASTVGLSNTGQFGGKSLQITTSDPSKASSTALATMYIPVFGNVVVAGAALGLTSIATGGADIGVTNGSVCHVFCRFILDQLMVFSGDPVVGGYTLLGTVNSGLLSSGWAYIEIVATIDPVAGAVAVYCNGVNAITLTNINTSCDGTGNIAGLALGAYDASGVGFAARFDDVYALDGTGAAPYSGMLGPVRVVTRFPTANSSVALTPLSSSNWSQVCEGTMDGDTSYNFSSTVGATDLFAAAGLTTTTSTVFAIKTKAAVRKDDAGHRAVATTLTSGLSRVGGTPVALSPAYQYISDIFISDPATSLMWTPINVSNSTFGYSVIS